VFSVRNSPLITNGEVVIHPRARGEGRGLDPGAPAATVHRAGDSDDGLAGWSVGWFSSPDLGGGAGGAEDDWTGGGAAGSSSGGRGALGTRQTVSALALCGCPSLSLSAETGKKRHCSTFVFI